MKNKPLAIFITDDHCSDKSYELVIDIHRQVRKKAIELRLSEVFHGGDLIDSRKAQSLTVLKAIAQICREYEQDGIELNVIPGNHSKPDYESEDSFLDVFDLFPAFNLIRDYGLWQKGDTWIHMVPYFKEDTTYSKYIDPVIDSAEEFDDKKHVLITHIAVRGVMNNDGTEVENDVTSNKFKCFDKVLIGHYHNAQTIGDNIVYTGSTHQHDFGEDLDKGMIVINDDLTLKQIKLDVPIYNNNVIDLNAISDDDLSQTIEDIKSSDNYEKIKFTGTEERLASVSKLGKKLESQGIKVDREVDDPQVDLSYTDLIHFTGFDPNTILEEWDSFSDKKELDKSESKLAKQQLQTVLIK